VKDTIGGKLDWTKLYAKPEAKTPEARDAQIRDYHARGLSLGQIAICVHASVNEVKAVLGID
jgi:hypothetical protein